MELGAKRRISNSVLRKKRASVNEALCCVCGVGGEWVWVQDPQGFRASMK